jgi:hypothetical protein
MQDADLVVSPSAAHMEKAFLYGASVAAFLAFSLQDEDLQLLHWNVLGIYLGEVKSMDLEIDRFEKVRDAYPNVVQLGGKLMTAFLVNGREDRNNYQLSDLIAPENCEEKNEGQSEPIDYDLSPSGFRFPEMAMQRHLKCEKLCEYWALIGWNVDPVVRGCDIFAIDSMHKPTHTVDGTRRRLTDKEAKRYDDDMASLLRLCGSIEGAQAYADDAVQPAIRMAFAAPFLDAIRATTNRDKRQIRKLGLFVKILRKFGL